MYAIAPSLGLRKLSPREPSTGLEGRHRVELGERLQSERRFAPCWHSSGHLKRLRREARWPRGQLHPRGTVGLPRTAGAGLDSPRLARTGGTLTSQELRGLPGKGGLRVGSLAGTRAPDTLPQPGGRSLGGLPLGADELKCSFLGRHAFFISTSLSPRKFFPTSSHSSLWSFIWFPDLWSLEEMDLASGPSQTLSLRRPGGQVGPPEHASVFSALGCDLSRGTFTRSRCGGLGGQGPGQCLVPPQLHPGIIFLAGLLEWNPFRRLKEEKNHQP